MSGVVKPVSYTSMQKKTSLQIYQLQQSSSILRISEVSPYAKWQLLARGKKQWKSVIKNRCFVSCISIDNHSEKCSGNSNAMLK